MSKSSDEYLPGDMFVATLKFNSGGLPMFNVHKGDLLFMLSSEVTHIDDTLLCERFIVKTIEAAHVFLHSSMQIVILWRCNDKTKAGYVEKL